MTGRISPRGAWRLARLAAHVAGGLAVAALVFPVASPAARIELGRRWARRALAALGVELHAQGVPIGSGALLVANHSSWLDILAIASHAPALFVAKSEVRGWPAIGWLAARAGTLFLERARLRHVREVKCRIAGLLGAGRSVAIFPEGTSTDGSQVLPFRPALLQAAVDSGRPVQPVAVAYYADGAPTDVAAFCGDMNLFQSLRQIVRAERLGMQLTFAAPLAAQACSRKALAREARAIIVARLALGPAAATGAQMEPPACPAYAAPAD